MSVDMADDVKIDISDGTGWDEYVLKYPGSFFYHLYGWGEVFEDVFGFKKIYLSARRASGAICGVLPLVYVKTFLGNKLVSIPIGVYAGALCDDRSVGDLLVGEAIKLSKKFGCDYLELRNMKMAEGAPATKELYVTFVKPLPASAGECLDRMPRKARAAARHAIDSGLTYELGLKYMDDCYDIYAINQKNLGSPVVSKSWFKKLAQVFKDKTDILAVKYNGRCIAAVLTFFYKDTVLPFYGGCIPGFFELNPNNYMYLKLQEYGVEKGYKFFDFGRSRKGSGSYSFKINQGFEPTQLYYQYYLNKAGKVPEISPSNKSFGAAKEAWKRLPLPVANWLGPKLFKYVIP